MSKTCPPKTLWPARYMIGMATQLHIDLIKAIPGVNSGRNSGFPSKVKAQLAKAYPDESLELWNDVFEDFHLYPDAWRLDGDVLTCYEVEVTSHLTDDKFNQYAELWFVLDTYDIGLKLICINRYNTPTEISLRQQWVTDNGVTEDVAKGLGI